MIEFHRQEAVVPWYAGVDTKYQWLVVQRPGWTTWEASYKLIGGSHPAQVFYTDEQTDNMINIMLQRKIPYQFDSVEKAQEACSKLSKRLISQ